MNKEFIDNNVEKLPFSGCWIWTGYVERNGYARFSRDGRGVHREAFRLYKGEPAEDAFVLHSCNIPSCVNPEHLYAGTQATNIQQMYSQGRGPFQVLMPSDVLTIRASSKKAKVLAKEYGVSHQQIYDIRNFKAWWWL